MPPSPYKPPPVCFTLVVSRGPGCIPGIGMWWLVQAQRRRGLFFPYCLLFIVFALRAAGGHLGGYGKRAAKAPSRTARRHPVGANSSRCNWVIVGKLHPGALVEWVSFGQDWWACLKVKPAEAFCCPPYAFRVAAGFSSLSLFLTSPS